MSRLFEKFLKIASLPVGLLRVVLLKVPSFPDKKHSKYRILVILPHLMTGGVCQMIFTILSDLDKNIFEVYIITTSPDTNTWQDRFVPISKMIINIPQLISKYPLGILTTWLTKKYILKIKPNKILITNSTAGYEVTRYIKRCLPSTKIYDLLHSQGLPHQKDAYLRISHEFDKFIDKRIVVSKYLKNYYINNYDIDPNKVLVIYNSPKKHAKLIHSTQINQFIYNHKLETRKIATFIGRLDPDKSPERLVMIAKSCYEHQKNWAFLVIGDGVLKNQLIKKSKDLGIFNKNIFFFGEASPREASEIFQKSIISLIVSDKEGIPISLLESMLSHTPCLSTAVGGIPEVIIHQINGWLIEIDNSPEKKIINNFVTNLRLIDNLSQSEIKSVQKSAYQTIESRFMNMSTEYKKIFLED